MSIQRLYEQYQKDVQFLSIYIREAHPIDGWWLGRRLTRGVISKRFPKVSMDHYDPKTIEERQAVAAESQAALQYSVPTYVDGINDVVNNAYATWPTRLYLVGVDGRVVFASKLGPLYSRPAKLKAAIEKYLRQNSLI